MKLIASAVLVGAIMSATANAATSTAAKPTPSTGAVAAAQPTLSPGQAVVQSMLDSVKALPAAKGNPKEQRKLLDTIDNSLALDLIAEKSLGPQWAKLKQSERRRFVALFTQALEKVAYPKAGVFLNDMKLSFLANVSKPDSESVRTMISKGDTMKAPLFFELARRGTRWQIVDVIVDGQSIAGGVEFRIQNMVKEQGYPKLVEELQKQIAAADKAS